MSTCTHMQTKFFLWEGLMEHIEAAKKMKISYYLIMELTFMQETTVSGFLFTTFDTFDNRNSITQTGTVHASSGKLFNRHLKLTSYFFKKVSNVKVKYIILNGFAKNSRAAKTPKPPSLMELFFNSNHFSI